MKILVYSINYLPELTGIGKYNGEMAEWLAGKGHEIFVITAPPYYPKWEVSEGYSSWRYRYEKINGVTIIRCPVWVPAKPSGLKRIIHLASFALSSFPIIVFKSLWRPNVILSIEPPLFIAPAALFSSWISRSSAWLHIQDFEVDAAFDLGILSSRYLRKKVLMVEQWLMNKFHRVSTISINMIRKLHDKGIAEDKAILFPNWVDIESIIPGSEPSHFRELLDLTESKVVYLYSGNMGEKQGLEIVVEAARLLKENNNVYFVMCGHGAAYESLKHLADGLGNIHWMPLQPLEKLNDLLNLADVHLLPQRADAADLVMPSKLTGMMASGRPVLATVDSDSQIATVLTDSGVIVSPGDLNAFTMEIKRLAANKELRTLLGHNARKFAENNLSKEAILSAVEKEFQDLINARIITNG